METKKKKKAYEVPRGSTGIKMQTQRVDLRTQGRERVSWDKVREWHGLIYTTKCKVDSQWEATAQHREISSVLCDHLEGWDREVRREMQVGVDMGIYAYVQLIHLVIKKKLTHHCKANILNKDVKKIIKGVLLKRLKKSKSEREKQIPYANTYILNLKKMFLKNLEAGQE